jgi:xanthine dehydrogenase YagR molybdenum-binding subunit
MRDALYYVNGPVPETPEPKQKQNKWKKTKVVGQPIPRVDAYDRLSGSAIYPSDVTLPGMLHGAMLRCPHAHARVTSIDTSKAEKMPGVRSVITDKTPGTDIPFYTDGEGNTVARLFDPHCRFEGEVVAAVAAETPYQARDALRAIEVGYEVLPFVVDFEKALDPGAPEVRDGGNRATEEQVYERGDLEQGFSEADLVLEETYRTACEIHTPMELHGCVARWDGNKLTVWESTQGVFSVQGFLSRMLDLPLSNIRVIGHYMGGGFGSKLWPGKYSVIAALLAKKTARPVKVFLTREETLHCIGNRPANRMRIKVGAKQDGTLTAIEFDALGSGGAYSTGGTGIVDWQIKDLYLCPNVKTIKNNVFINANEQRPMRAPGHPQGSWALEQILDTLAEKLKMDPVELRVKNVPELCQGRGDIPYTSTGFKDCLEKGAKEFGWEAARAKKPADGHRVRGVGMGGATWIAGAGGPPSTAIVTYFLDGSVKLNMGASDIGTGTKTVMAMVVAEELGVDLDLITIENADTGTTQFATGSGGSKTVHRITRGAGRRHRLPRAAVGHGRQAPGGLERRARASGQGGGIHQ